MARRGSGRRTKGRNGNTSPAEIVVDLIAMLPWWAGVLIAFVSYTVLHRYAFQPAAGAPLVPGQMGDFVAGAMWRAVAGVGQYLLPFFCLVGAAISAYRRRQRKTLLANAQAGDSLDGISWQEFELLVGEAFRLQGYSVTETGGDGRPDGGVDLVLRKGGEKYFVQCKQWKAFTVGVRVVRELYGVMAAHGAAGGFVVTSGSFTNDADAFAAGRNVTLVDGDGLRRMIRSAKAARSASVGLARQRVVAGAQPTVVIASVAHAGASTKVVEPLLEPEAGASIAAVDATPACPVCAKPMMRRVAKKGGNAGQAFWGCGDFPGCRGTREVG